MAENDNTQQQNNSETMDRKINNLENAIMNISNKLNGKDTPQPKPAEEDRLTNLEKAIEKLSNTFNPTEEPKDKQMGTAEQIINQNKQKDEQQKEISETQQALLEKQTLENYATSRGGDFINIYNIEANQYASFDTKQVNQKIKTEMTILAAQNEELFQYVSNIKKDAVAKFNKGDADYRAKHTDKVFEIIGDAEASKNTVEHANKMSNADGSGFGNPNKITLESIAKKRAKEERKNQR